MLHHCNPRKEALMTSGKPPMHVRYCTLRYPRPHPKKSLHEMLPTWNIQVVLQANFSFLYPVTYPNLKPGVP